MFEKAISGFLIRRFIGRPHPSHWIATELQTKPVPYPYLLQPYLLQLSNLFRSRLFEGKTGKLYEIVRGLVGNNNEGEAAIVLPQTSVP